MTTWHFLGVALAGVATLGVAAGRARGAGRSIADTMRGFIQSGEIAGAVTLVVRPDGVAHLEAIGYSDLASKTPLRTDDIFWIASMTKPITATAVMMLVEQGKIALDDPADKYIPELGKLTMRDGRPVKVTLRQMLTHTAGMSENSPAETRAARTLADLIPGFAGRPMMFEPGTRWAYSQSGINSLGRIVEIVSGLAFEEFLQQRLFEPLGMPDTTFYLSTEQKPRLARSYKLEKGELIEASVFILEGHDATYRYRYPAANGGLFSTAADYGRFMRMILNEGQLDGRRYLKPQSVRQMTSLHTGDLKTGFTEGCGWGLGWCVVRQPRGITAALSPGSFGHGGAYGTQAWIDPVQKIGYVLMVQRANFENSDGSEVRRAFQDAARAQVLAGEGK